MIFVDISVWFARFVPKGLNHIRTTTWLDENSEVLTTSDYCVDEVLTLLSVRERPSLAVEAGREFFDETLARLHYLSTTQIQRAWILFQQRAAAGGSFTDCTSKVLIDDLGITSAASFDRHFEHFGVQILPTN